MSVNEDEKSLQYHRWRNQLDRDDNPSTTIKELLKALQSEKEFLSKDQIFLNKYLPSYIKSLLEKRYYLYHEIDYYKILEYFFEVTDLCLSMLSKDPSSAFDTILRLLDYDKNLYDKHYSPVSYYSERELKQQFESKVTKKEEFYFTNHNKSLNILMNLYLNYFGNIDGFKILAEFIPKASFEQITQILYTIVNLDDIMPTHPWKRVSKAIYKQSIAAVERYSEDLKILQKQDLRFFFLNLEKVLDKLYSSLKVGKIVEKLELEIAFKMLVTSTLEKKIYGITEIVTKITQARNLDEDNEKRSRGFCVYKSDFREVAKWLTTDLLLDWLESKDLVTIIFGPTSHHEIIKRSSDLIRFLYTNSLFPQEKLENLWEIAFSKHEAEREALLSLIQDLITVLDSEDLHFLYSKLRSLSFNQIDSQILQLLKSYARLGNYFRPSSKKLRKTQAPEKLVDPPPVIDSVPLNELKSFPFPTTRPGTTVGQVSEHRASEVDYKKDSPSIEIPISLKDPASPGSYHEKSPEIFNQTALMNWDSEEQDELAKNSESETNIEPGRHVEGNIEISEIYTEKEKYQREEEKNSENDGEKKGNDGENRNRNEKNKENNADVIFPYPFIAPLDIPESNPQGIPRDLNNPEGHEDSSESLSSSIPEPIEETLEDIDPESLKPKINFTELSKPSEIDSLYPAGAKDQRKAEDLELKLPPNPIPAVPSNIPSQTLQMTSSSRLPVIQDSQFNSSLLPNMRLQSSHPVPISFRSTDQDSMIILPKPSLTLLNPESTPIKINPTPGASLPPFPGPPISFPPMPSPGSSLPQFPSPPKSFPAFQSPTLSLGQAANLATGPGGGPSPVFIPSGPSSFPPVPKRPVMFPPVPRPLTEQGGVVSHPPNYPPVGSPSSSLGEVVRPDPKNPSETPPPAPSAPSRPVAGQVLPPVYPQANPANSNLRPGGLFPGVFPPTGAVNLPLSNQVKEEKRFDSSEVLLFIWELWQESASEQGVTSDTAEQAMSILKDSLVNYFRLERPKYLSMCVDNLKASSFVLWSCDMIKAILESYPSVRPHFERSESKSSMIHCLEQDFELTKQLFRSLIQFKQSAVIKAIQVNGEDSTSSSDDETFESRRSYESLFSEIKVSKDLQISFLDEVSSRLDFIRYIYSNSCETITNWHLSVLWETFIFNAVSEKESELVFHWLTSCINSWPNRILESEDLQLHVFTELLLKIKPFSYTRAAFECFERFFININRHFGLISSICTDENLEIIDVQLISFQALWEITLASRCEYVFYLGSSLIKRVYKGLKVCTQEIQEDFIKTCMSHIEAVPVVLDEDSVTKISRCLILISDFIEEFESLPSQTGEVVQLNITKKTKTSSQSVSISLPLTATLSEAKQKVSEMFKLKSFTKFEWNGKNLDKVQGFLTLKDLQFDDNSCLTVFDEDSSSSEMPLPNDYENSLESLKSMFENLSEDLLKLALEKSDNQVDDAVCFLTGEGNIEMLQEQLEMQEKREKTEKLVKTVTRYKLTEIISNDHTYFSQLFDLFSYGNLQINLKIWQLLNKVSVNVQAFEEIKNLDQVSLWDSLFDSSCTFKLLYSLQIADEIIQKDFSDDWREKLFKTGGLKHLYSVFTRFKELGLEPSKGPFESKVIDYLIKILSSYLSTNCRVSEAKSLMTLSDFLETTTEIMQISLSPQENSGLILARSLDCFVIILNHEPELLALIYQKGIFQQLISDTLLNCEESFIRQTICQTVESIKSIGSIQHVEDSSSYFAKLVLNCLPADDNQNCDEFFALTQALAADLLEHDALFLDRCVEFVLMRDSIETRAKCNQDKVLAGYLAVLKPLVEMNPRFKSKELLSHLYSCLFLLDPCEASPPRYKHPATRNAAFDLIQALCFKNSENSRFLLDKLYFHHSSQKSSTSDDFSPAYAARVDNEIKTRAPSGFVGLRNFGSTCYMNSLMQQLFMMTEVRSGLIEARLSSDLDLNENVLFQLQTMLINLQESEKEYFEPFGFCQAFKCYDGEPINVRVQQDVDEFLSLLFDKLEELLKNSSSRNLLRDHIGGSFIHEIHSTEAARPYYGSREEHFFRISLDVKNKKNLQEALDLFVKDDVLEGDNKYFCDQYDTKITAKKRCLISSLANTVLIHLKRFEFDYSIMQRFKINDYCEFPMNINFKNWAKHEDRPAEYFEYELAGVLLHSGGADSGHYTSIIKDRNSGKWLLFDDRYVEVYSIDNLKNDCFGGERTVSWGADFHSFAQSKNAYMLVYERKFPVKVVKAENHNEGVSFVTQIAEKIRSENLNFLRDLLYFDRGYFKLLADFILNFDFVEDKEYSEELSATKDIQEIVFLTSFVEEDETRTHLTKETLLNLPEVRETLQKIEDRETDDESLKIIKLGTLFAYENLTRVKNFENFKFWLKILIKFYRKHIKASIWFLNYLIQNREIISEILLDCIDSESRAEFSSFISQILNFVSESEGQLLLTKIRVLNLNALPYSEFCGYNHYSLYTKRPLAVSSRFIELYLKDFLHEFKRNSRRIEDYLIILVGFAESGPLQKALLVDSDCINELVSSLNESDNLGSVAETEQVFALLSSLMLVCRTSAIRASQNFPPYLETSKLSLELDSVVESQMTDYHVKRNIVQNIRNRDVERIVLHLSWENLKLSLNFLEEFAGFLLGNKYENFKVTGFLMILQKILLLDDSIKERRVHEFIVNTTLRHVYSLPSRMTFFEQVQRTKDSYCAFAMNIILWWADLMTHEHVLRATQQNSHQFRWIALESYYRANYFNFPDYFNRGNLFEAQFEAAIKKFKEFIESDQDSSSAEEVKRNSFREGELKDDGEENSTESENS